MKILVSYRGIPQSPGWATGDCVVRAFRALGHETTPYGNYYQTGNRLEQSLDCLNEEYDLLLFMECGDGDPVYSELVNVRTRKRASWFFDAALYPQIWLDIIRIFEFDINFIANRSMLYDSFKTEYLPYAADETIHYRSPGHHKYRTFGYIGSDRPERQALAHRINTELKSGIYREDFINYLAGSKYAINDIAGGGTGLIPMRPFEALMAGTAIITPKDDGVKALGLPCVEYDSIDELVSICRHLHDYNISPDNTGQAEVLRNHTYKNRCVTILENMFPYG